MILSVVAIDPGDKKSAIVRYNPPKQAVVESLFEENERVLDWLRVNRRPQPLLIEMIASYGMPVGKEVFETCVWIGRFAEAWGAHDVNLVYRRDVKMHLCGTAKAKDGNIRAALLDKFGGPRSRGTKKSPGPLYGISGDKWAALAVAVMWAETR